jgi:hypothetical protein
MNGATKRKIVGRRIEKPGKGPLEEWAAGLKA